MIGRWVSFWDCLFLGAMLNFRGVLKRDHFKRFKISSANFRGNVRFQWGFSMHLEHTNIDFLFPCVLPLHNRLCSSEAQTKNNRNDFYLSIKNSFEDHWALGFPGVFFHIPIRQALVESGATLDESCLVRELLVDVPENPALQGMDLESWSMSSGEPRKNAPSYHGEPQNPSIFRGYNIYNPYIGGLKPSFFMVLGSNGNWLFKRDPYI